MVLTKEALATRPADFWRYRELLPVRHTANIDIAIEKGADLVICYNPFRPFRNQLEDEEGEVEFAAGGHLSDRGLMTVLNQVCPLLDYVDGGVRHTANIDIVRMASTSWPSSRVMGGLRLLEKFD